ncbi:membrane protein [Microbacterium phage Kauala]|nr:membrane protein [Microbacterium phage Kauala]
MKTEIDPRPVTSFDDLLAFTEAELEELHGPQPTLWDKVLAVLVWIPILVAVALVVIAVCFLVWWGIYGDDVIKGSLYGLAFFFEVLGRGF